ncbi:MAG: hypothetical protein ACOYNC_10195 [Bacteroidales bacterium]
MKKQLFFLVLLFCASLLTQAANWHVNPLGTDDPLHGTATGAGAFKTIQYAITAAASGDVINVAPGTYVEANILVDKNNITIQGTGATRDAVIIVSTGSDANVDNAFGSGALNGFIIKAHDATIRKLTINGNPLLTPGVYNFRAGIVTHDPTGVWNNLHVDNVAIKYAWRRGISVFPRTVSGTVIENSSVEYIAYNQGMYLAGHSVVLNNSVKHCFQGIVQNPDASTPRGLFKINGNTVTEIGNYPGCFNYPNSQPRAIQFDAADPTFRTVEIKNNTINDNGYTGLVGTVGIYTRRANAASLVQNNTITLGSGSSFSVVGGSQSVGLLLGWSYAHAFTANLNHINTNAYGIGIMLIGVGTSSSPMILEGNVLVSTASTHLDKGDGTGIYIANQYLFNALDKFESFVKIQNHNSITGFVRGIEAEKIATSAFPLTVSVHNNLLSGNTTGIYATTLIGTIDATNNYWGGSGPNDGALYPAATGSSVTANVAFTPWWCDALMTTACPSLTPGMAILNTNTGVQYTAAQLLIALNAAADGERLYIAPGTVNSTFSYTGLGKTVSLVGSGIPGMSQLDGTLFLVNGNLVMLNGISLANGTSTSPVSVANGNLKLRNCTVVCPPAGSSVAGVQVIAGTIDAGTSEDPGNNVFVGTSTSIAIQNDLNVGQYAIGNNWGSPSGPTVSSNPSGTGCAIFNLVSDSVYYAPFANGPISTIASVFVCAGATTVDIPVTATNFNSVGSLALTFGFTPAQLTAPQIVYTNPAFSSWGPFTYTTDGGLLAGGTFKVSGFGPLPANGVTLTDGDILFTLRFNILPNLGTNSTAPVFFDEDIQGTACEYAGVAPAYHPFNDIPTSAYYLNGGVTLNGRHKISGVFTYYNTANVILTAEDITVKVYRSSDAGHSTVLGTTTTNSSGYYEFYDLCPDDTYDIVATSTHTTAGSVNTTDAAQVNFWPIAPTSIEKVRFFAGDVGTLVPYVQEDWYLSATDAQRIQQNFVNGKAFDRPWTFWKAGQFIAANPVAPAESFPTVNIPVGLDVTANMYGLCTGDFNRSFNPLLKKSASKSLTLVYGRSMLVTSGQQFDLPVHIVNASSVGAVSLIITFPSNLVEITDVKMNSTNGQLDWAVNGDELRIGWNSMVAADLGAFDNLVTLTMVTRETWVKGSSIRLELAADPLNELANASYDVIGNAILSVDVVESSPDGIGEQSDASALKFRNYPNPFTNHTTITYTLPFAGNVVVEIRNTFGELVKVLVNDMQVSGGHTLNFDAAGLAAGIYTASIKLSGSYTAVNSTIKLVISK